jgi:hypothetical protein
MTTVIYEKIDPSLGSITAAGWVALTLFALHLIAISINHIKVTTLNLNQR